MEKKIQQLAEALDQFAYENDFYEYEDTIADHELHIQELRIQIRQGNTERIEEWLKTMLEESSDTTVQVEAEELLSQLKEIVKASETEIMNQTAKISFYVAECMEFPSLGEYHDNLTLEEAYTRYELIPEERMHGIKGIGFCLEDGSIYDGDYELMAGGEISRELIELVPHYKESPLVQMAIRELENLLKNSSRKR